jgi:O-antigen ligase
MKLFVVAAAYAVWLAAISIVFFLIHGHNVAAQESSVLAGLVPMLLQYELLGFEPHGMVLPAGMMGAFIFIVLLSYVFNGGDWTAVTYVIELLYLSAVTIFVAGSPDRRLFCRIAEYYSLPAAVWLVYIDMTGKYLWGRLVAGGLQANFWGLVGVSVGVSAFANRSRLAGAFCYGAGLLTIYESSSRSSLVALAIATILIAARYLGELRNRRLIGAAAVIALGLAFAMVLIPSLQSTIPNFFASILKLDDPLRGIGSGETGRSDLWRAAFGLWLDHPLIGVGFRMHELYLPADLSAHNAYLAMLADTGVFGCAWYVLLLITCWLGMFRIKDQGTRHLIIGLVSSYTFVGLFERRAINGANPMSVLFLMAAMYLYGEVSLAAARRKIAHGESMRASHSLGEAGGEAAS